MTDSEHAQKIQKTINESVEIISKIGDNSKEIIHAVNQIIRCISDGKKIIIFGNGGSAADAQHIAAELIGRFVRERRSYPAIALTTDTSALTAIGNDYSFDDVFGRQCDGIVDSNDVVIGISTSGNSENVRRGLKTSKEKGALAIGLLGNDGGKIKDITDISIIVDSKSTARIQEGHRVIYHLICQLVEEELSRMEES